MGSVDVVNTVGVIPTIVKVVSMLWAPKINKHVNGKTYIQYLRIRYNQLLGR